MTLEHICRGIRHSMALKSFERTWALVRPFYEAFVSTAYRNGIPREINGTDQFLLSPKCRSIQKSYEPEIWPLAMACAKPGSRIIDVGAFVGLYALALGKRVIPNGTVLAFEPDSGNRSLLEENVRLNHLQNLVQILPFALSDSVREAKLAPDHSQSKISAGGDVTIQVTTLDAMQLDGAWDLMLIDVEGFEQKVLQGGRQLLGDRHHRPSVIIVEVHPYAWKESGCSSEGLISELTMHGYELQFPDGSRVDHIDHYGHIIAMRPSRT